MGSIPGWKRIVLFSSILNSPERQQQMQIKELILLARFVNPSMELWYLLALLTWLLLLLRLIRNKRSDQTPASRLPPGPWKMPIIGSMHHLMGSSLPHHTLRDLARKHGPLMHLKLGEVFMLVVSSPEAAQEILRTHDASFASRPQLLATQLISYEGKGMAFAPYGDYWRQLRKLCILELLSAKRVHSFWRIREEEVDHLVRSISSATGLVNLTEKLYSLTNDFTSRSVLGMKCTEQQRFISLMRGMIEVGGAFNLADFFPSSRVATLVSGLGSKQRRYHVEVDEIISAILEEHKGRRAAARGAGEDLPEEADLLDVLLRLQESGELEFTLTTDHIKALLLDLFVAGSETTSSTMLWTMSELMRNPKVMKKAQAEAREALKGKEKLTEEDICGLHYLKLVIKETLRLHPPIPLLLPRESREACEVQGYVVPKKARVVVNAWAMGRDPRNWDDAESFVPERFEGGRFDFKGTQMAYIPFGAGRRICPGMVFGMASMELPLARLLYHFDWELPGGSDDEDLDMSETFGATSSKREDLCLFAIPWVPICGP